MTRLIADETLPTKLSHLTDEVEICDAHGKLLGYFVPVEDKDLYREVQLPATVTPEEMERRYREGGGKSLAQIWKELGRN